VLIMLLVIINSLAMSLAKHWQHKSIIAL